MANRDTLMLTRLIAEIARQRRTDQRCDRMLALIERQHEVYGAGFDYANAPSPERAAALESAAIDLAAAALRLAAEGCDPAAKELAHAD